MKIALFEPLDPRRRPARVPSAPARPRGSPELIPRPPEAPAPPQGAGPPPRAAPGRLQRLRGTATQCKIAILAPGAEGAEVFQGRVRAPHPDSAKKRGFLFIIKNLY